MEQTTPKFEKVIEGTAKVSSSVSPGQFLKDFIQEDFSTVGRSMLLDVLYPKAKQAIYDALQSGLSMLFWGTAKTTRSSSVSSGTKVNYAGMSSSNKLVSANNSAISARRTGSSDPWELELETITDARDLLDRMRDAVAQYHLVTVSDMYYMAGLKNDNYTLEKIGWDDLDGVEARYKGNGSCHLTLPRPKRIKQ